MPIAHINLQGGASLAAFGTDWLYVLVPGLGMIAVAVALALYGREGAVRPLRDFEAGAAKLTGLPSWVAAPIVVLLGGLLYAVTGFFWDVAWHIAIGRDEFLFSPPHVCLLLGITLIGLAGLAGVVAATRAQAAGQQVSGWRRGRLRVPYGAAVLVVSGAVAGVGFGVDELWHWAYGLDVTMWSPPHLSMISAAVFTPMAAWLLLAEAGPGAGRKLVRLSLLGLFMGATLIALSAWQLEFDLGVPQWRQAFHPFLVAVAGGFALTAGRAAMGAGGALLTSLRFVVLRFLLLLLTTQVWGLPEPRFVPYVAAAVAVELAFLLTRRARPLHTALAAGAGVATLGLAGAAWITSVWAWNPWTAGLWRAAAPIAAAAVAAAVLGMAFGRVVSHRPSGVQAGQVVAALAAILLGIVVLVPRSAPALRAEVRTTPAGPDQVTVDLTVAPADGAEGAERFQVMAWQGGGLVVAPLSAVAGQPGRYRAEQPVPHGGNWKTIVRFARGEQLGALPISMPDDPAINAEAVPLLPLRRGEFVAESGVLLREAHAGPAWPSIVGFAFVGLGVSAIIGLLVAGTVALDRRRRAPGWPAAEQSLAGYRVLITGAEGGIGRATRAALERQGALVVGIDLHSSGPGTLVADVRDDEAMRDAVHEAARRLGGLDVVIANAGIGEADDSGLPPSAAAHNVMEINFFGGWRLIGEAMPYLRESGGTVVVIGSGLARVNMPFAAAYSAAKRALVGYADVLRVESDGAITVGVVQPAYIRTAIHDGPATSGASLDGVARVETVDDAAAAIITVIETGRREIGSSPITTLQVALARKYPALVDRAIAQRLRALEKVRERPVFTRTVKLPDSEAPPGTPADELRGQRALDSTGSQP